MRILNLETDKTVNHISLVLTRDEARQLAASLTDMLDDAEITHCHVSNTDYSKELVVCLYEPGGKNDGYSQRVRRLIDEDR